MPAKPTYLFIRSINRSSAQAMLCIGHRQFPCLIGRNGRTFFKREGDGKSPHGKWKLCDVFYRPDKFGHVRNGRVIRKIDGWCDDPQHPCYNKHVKLPLNAGHENLWREDSAYDLVISTDHNQRPRQRGAGSAIFFHLIREGAAGTEGCIAIRPKDLPKILRCITGNAYLVI